MLSGNNVQVARKDYTDFAVLVYLNACEKETEANGVDLYHGVCEFQKTDGTMITVKPIVNEEVDNIHGHFKNDEAGVAFLQATFERIIKMIDEGIAGASEAVFYDGMLRAAELERTIYAMAEENPAINLMLSAGLSPLDIYNLMTSMDDDEVEGQDVPLLGGFSLN